MYDVTLETLVKVQAIEGHGAHRLALNLVNGTWILVIGNREGGKEQGESCSTQTEIYQWSPSTSQFQLLRQVVTIDVVDVSIVSIEKEGLFHESYLAIAENGGSVFGKVSIYKWEGATRNFYIAQEIEYEGIIGGLHGLSLPQFTYFIMALPSGRLEFYKYAHLEVLNYIHNVQGFVIGIHLVVLGIPTGVGCSIERWI